MEIWKQAAIEHAKSDQIKEVCGLVVIIKGRKRYWPCKNLAIDQDFFVLDPEDWARAEDAGEIVAVFHSHPLTDCTPSQADQVACEKSQIPWYIYSPHNDRWAKLEPSGYKAPLIGREWVWGITDCWSLARDWYAEEMGIELRDWDRPTSMLKFAEDPMFERCWKMTGFVDIPIEKMQHGDLVLMSIEQPGLNHIGVYLDHQTLLHHMRGRLSSRDVYGGYYLKSTGRVLRHASKVT